MNSETKYKDFTLTLTRTKGEQPLHYSSTINDPYIYTYSQRRAHRISFSVSLHQHLRSTITITITHNLLMSHYCSTKMTIKLTLYTHTPHNLFLLLRGMTHSRVFSFCIVAGGPHRCVCGVGTLYKCVYRYIVYSTTSL